MTAPINQNDRDRLAKWMGWELLPITRYPLGMWGIRLDDVGWKSIVTRGTWSPEYNWKQAGMLLERAQELDLEVEIERRHDTDANGTPLGWYWNCCLLRWRELLGGAAADTGPEAVAAAVLAMLEESE